MARPRVIRYGEGEITLKNIPSDVADKIKAFVSELDSGAAPPTTSTTDQLTHVAIGTIESPEGYYVSKILYSPSTKQARVESVKMAGKEKSHAVEQFKILAVSNKLV